VPDFGQVQLFRASVHFEALGVFQVLKELVGGFEGIVSFVKKDVEQAFEPDSEFVEGNSSEIGDVIPSFNGFLHFGLGFIDFVFLDEGVGELGESMRQSYSCFSDLCFEVGFGLFVH
jgi:hypothetical protein